MEKTGYLSFIFTPDTFRLDVAVGKLNDEEKRWEEEFSKNRYKALFRLGLEKQPETGSSFWYWHGVCYEAVAGECEPAKQEDY